VIATASPSKHDLVRALGADLVLESVGPLARREGNPKPIQRPHPPILIGALQCPHQGVYGDFATINAR
jgi:hypothetical protein